MRWLSVLCSPSDAFARCTRFSNLEEKLDVVCGNPQLEWFVGRGHEIQGHSRTSTANDYRLSIYKKT